MDKVLVGRGEKGITTLPIRLQERLLVHLVDICVRCGKRRGLRCLVSHFGVEVLSLNTHSSQNVLWTTFCFSSYKCHQFGVDFDSEDSKLANSVLK